MSPCDGDRVILKRSDDSFDVQKTVILEFKERIESLRFSVQEAISSLEQARLVARAGLPPNGTVWYREQQHSAGHLERF